MIGLVPVLGAVEVRPFQAKIDPLSGLEAEGLPG